MRRIILLRRNTCYIFGVGFLLILILIVSNSIFKRPDPIYLDTKDLMEVKIMGDEYPYLDFSWKNKDLQILINKRYPYTIIGKIQDIPRQGQYELTFVYSDQSLQTITYSQLLGIFYDNKQYELSLPEELTDILYKTIAAYEYKAYETYGVLIPWNVAKEIFPMFSNARVIDIYSGASFNIQRRAGSHHVDAQPLTADDTAIMKKIFNGRWSWKRSGIIVEIDGYRIAASMNGMPHGSGKIHDNNFSGHFCIHFLNSTTHSGNMDKEHLQEILKAAGKLPLTS